MRKNIEIEEAYKIFENNIKDVEIEEIDISKGLGYILAEDIYSPINQPPFSKSAMDGITLNFKNLKENFEFTINSTIYAGDDCSFNLKDNEVYKIMTGAKIPVHCDIVIPQENCIFYNGKVIIKKFGKKGSNICFLGEDFQKGELLLKKGEKLDYINLALLSSIGVTKIKVYKKIKIALLISGDEVSSPWETLKAGKIFDSNGMLLTQRLKELGYEVSIFEYLEDSALKTSIKLKELASQVDIIFTTGGVSVGEKDIFHEAIELARGKKLFWRVNLKPGTPALFSTIDNCPILSLSGNPFAACVTFELLGRYILGALQKDPLLPLKKNSGVLISDFPKGGDKRRFIRGRYSNGKVEIPNGLHSSYALGSMRGCNVLIDIPAGSEGIKSGEEIVIWEL
jgi:molybdopterin molybdotransferase